MFDRIAVHEADMALHIDDIADFVIPVARVPDLIEFSCWDETAFDQAPNKARLQIGDPAMNIIIVFRKHPNGMQMIRQDHSRDRIERMQAFEIARTI